MWHSQHFEVGNHIFEKNTKQNRQKNEAVYKLRNAKNRKWNEIVHREENTSIRTTCPILQSGSAMVRKRHGAACNYSNSKERVEYNRKMEGATTTGR